MIIETTFQLWIYRNSIQHKREKAQFIQVNQITGRIIENKEATEKTIEKAEFDFMIDLKSLIVKSEQDDEIHRVRASMKGDEKQRKKIKCKMVMI